MNDAPPTFAELRARAESAEALNTRLLASTGEAMERMDHAIEMFRAALGDALAAKAAVASVIGGLLEPRENGYPIPDPRDYGVENWERL